MQVLTDAICPLHLLPVTYEYGYGPISEPDLKVKLDVVFEYIEQHTSAYLQKTSDNQSKIDINDATEESVLGPSVFRLTSYEWGVTYFALMESYENLYEEKYKNYVEKCINFLTESRFTLSKKLNDGNKYSDNNLKHLVFPENLDDFGAIAFARSEAQSKGFVINDKACKLNYDDLDFIMHKEHKLKDGTIARNRPFPDTLWLDDMFMALPFLMSQANKSDQNTEFKEEIFNFVTNQIISYASKMQSGNTKLFAHGHVAKETYHPEFYWGRANGWVALTLVLVLERLPKYHIKYQKIFNIFLNHINGIVECQGLNGFYHQLLNKHNTYEETSCTAIFSYVLAKAINLGLISEVSYGPYCTLGIHAVLSKIDKEGMIHDTCVGTGMGFDPAFYSHRPKSQFAAHGYGPTILAINEFIKLSSNFSLVLNDCALHLYRK